MIKKITVLFTSIFLLTSLMFPVELNAITAEDRLIEVERQLQAIAEQISKYEGDRTDLEIAIIANDKDLAQVNSELAEVQSRLAVVERELEKALENYDISLDDLVAVQENIINEQIKLGKIKNEIADVSSELFETQKNLLVADESLQEQAVNLYINGVMSPTTALGYASTVVDSAYAIVEQLNALESLASSQTEFLTQREDERVEVVSNLQNEEEKKNEISIEAEQFADEIEDKKEAVEREKRIVESKKAQVVRARQNAQNLLNQANKELEKLDKEHADLEKLEDAIQADIDRLSSSGGVAPSKLAWPVTTGYVSSGYKWRRLGGTTSFHGAIDIAASRGTPIKAAGGGVVILARYYGLAGRTVFIDHGGGLTTLYFHMDKILVNVGQTVFTGDQIGTVGNTGRSTGPHLHFETRLRSPSSANCSLPYLDPTSRGRVNPYCFLN
jgi:murein DD-endopeptidase MepM/ murein hydrolase activator NlpD